MAPSPPQLSVGQPFDLSADVPIFPPFATFCVVLLSFVCCFFFGRKPIRLVMPYWVRAAVVSVAIGYTRWLMTHAGGELEAVGSGVMFTPVGGLATGGIYQYSRNPLYASLVFIMLPSAALLFNTYWPIYLSPLLWAYLHYIVIAAEESLLAAAYPALFRSYIQTVPRWLSISLW